jgi:cytoskeleton protein RodZ
MDLREDIGTPLRHARTVRGIARSDAARDLDIPEQFLTDLEEGRFAAFGPWMHAAAYVRLYARYLGLDEDRVLAEAFSGLSTEPPPAPDRPRRWWFAAAAALVVLGALGTVMVVLVLEPPL